MKDSNKNQTEYREPFPYKTYEEIRQDKDRRQRFHHGMVVMSGIFLMFCAVIIGVGVVWNQSATPVKLLRMETQTGEPDLSALTQAAGLAELSGRLNDFTLPMPGIPTKEIDETEDVDLIRVTDVSDVVKKARASVVGVEAESYTGLITGRSGSGIKHGNGKTSLFEIFFHTGKIHLIHPFQASSAAFPHCPLPSTGNPQQGCCVRDNGSNWQSPSPLQRQRGRGCAFSSVSVLPRP